MRHPYAEAWNSEVLLLRKRHRVFCIRKPGVFFVCNISGLFQLFEYVGHVGIIGVEVQILLRYSCSAAALSLRMRAMSPIRLGVWYL